MAIDDTPQAEAVDREDAEAFDEETTGGQADLETSYPYDRDREVRDETAALGDADLDGDEVALDADEEDDELLDTLEQDEDEDDLDDDDRDEDPLNVDNIPDAVTDRDFLDPDVEDGVAAAPSEDVEAVDMGDMTQFGAERTTADLESENLSDSDLEELDYKGGRA